MLPSYCKFLKTIQYSVLIGPLQLSDHMVQKSPYWRANATLGHVKQRKFKFGGFVLDAICSTLRFWYHVITHSV